MENEVKGIYAQLTGTGVNLQVNCLGYEAIMILGNIIAEMAESELEIDLVLKLAAEYAKAVKVLDKHHEKAS